MASKFQILLLIFLQIYAIHTLLIGEDEETNQHYRERKRHHKSGFVRRMKHRKSDDESSQKADGLWAIYDIAAFKAQNNDSKGFRANKHKHPPTCLLIQMRASLVIPIAISVDNEGQERKIINKTIVVPKEAQVRGQCGKTQQRITFMWNNTHDSGKLVKEGELTFLFTKFEAQNAIYLTHAWASVALFLEDGLESMVGVRRPSQTLYLYVKGTQELGAPFRFAFVCHNGLTLDMQATTMPIQSDDDVIVDPVDNDEGYLVIHDIMVEAFRTARYGKHFTHLKYDCKDKFPYGYVPVLMAIAIFAHIVIFIVAFIFRKKCGCGDNDGTGGGQSEALFPQQENDLESEEETDLEDEEEDEEVENIK